MILVTPNVLGLQTVFRDINIGKGRLQGEARKPDYTKSNFP
jgi:hypothetical protein